MKSKIWIILILLAIASLMMTQCSPATPAATSEAEQPVTEEAAEPAGAEGEDQPAGSSAEEKVSLLVWDQFTDEDASAAFDQIIENFQAQNPNIEIKREIQQLETLQATINTALASGTGPDIVYYDTGPGFAGVLARAGLLLPLDEYSDQYGWDQRIYQWASDLSTFDGKLYGLGLESEFVGMFFNQAILEQEGLEVPETFEEVLEYCAAAQEKGYIPFAFSMNPGWQSYHPFSGFVTNILGKEELEKMILEGQGGWNREEVVRAIQMFFSDMEQAGCFPPGVNGLSYDDGNSLFYTGQASGHITGTWLNGGIIMNMDEDDVSLYPFPSIDGGPRFFPGGIGSAWFISANTANPDQATQFLDYLFTEEAAQVWVEQAAFIPPISFDPSGWNISSLVEFTINKLNEASTGSADAGGLGYFIELYSPAQFITMLEDGSQAILAGEKTAEQQAEDLQKAWEEGRE